MMKKHDEGYVLAFVLIVIVVLCLVAVSMMTVALQNIQAQTASVKQMQNKYTAMGDLEIEQMNVESLIKSSIVVQATDTADALAEALDLESVKSITLDSWTPNVDSTSFVAKVIIESCCEDTQIECTYTWEGEFIKSTEGNNAVRTTKWNCTSYNITTVSPTESEVTP